MKSLIASLILAASLFAQDSYQPPSLLRKGLVPSTSSAGITVASGTAALGTSAIASGACATVVTATATGALSTDSIAFTANTDISGVTGYAPVTTGGLIVYNYPTADTVNFKVCNPTSSSITPGAVTLNWDVIRIQSVSGGGGTVTTLTPTNNNIGTACAGTNCDVEAYLSFKEEGGSTNVVDYVDCVGTGISCTTSGTIPNRVMTMTVNGASASTTNLAGTYSARPAAGTEGRTYFCEDCGNLMWRDTGAAWVGYFNGTQKVTTVPLVATFTAVNTPTTSDDNGFLRLTATTAGGENFKTLLKAWSAVNGATVLMQPQYGAEYNQCGLVLTDGTTTAAKLIVLGVASLSTSQASINIGKYTNYTTYDSGASYNSNYSHVPVWLRISVSGGNRLYQFSLDGKNFTTALSEADNTHLTATYVGIGCNSNNGLYPATANFYSWSN
jgi:hypothetical protein